MLLLGARRIYGGHSYTMPPVKYLSFHDSFFLLLNILQHEILLLNKLYGTIKLLAALQQNHKLYTEAKVHTSKLYAAFRLAKTHLVVARETVV